MGNRSKQKRNKINGNQIRIAIESAQLAAIKDALDAFDKGKKMSKVFIWDYVSNLTDSYHSSGGLVVIADNLQDAKILAMEQDVKFDDETPTVYELKDTVEDEVYIFPDAGCC